MRSLLVLPSLQQTAALPGAWQMRSLATSALPDAPVTPVDNRRAWHSRGGRTARRDAPPAAQR